MENKSFIKKLTLLFIVLLFSQISFAASNVIDVKISETIYDEVLYNPLKPTSGLFVDNNENRTVYNLTGEIIISNNHPTESVQNIVLNISGITNIYNITNSSGKVSYVTEFNSAGNYMIIMVPDLAPNSNATLSYKINTSNIAPPLNFTTNYSDSKIFAGLDLGVTDRVENILNSTVHPNNCIYGINIIQNALDINQSGVTINFTIDPTSLTGSDASNASVSSDNRTLTWNTLNSNCLYSSNVTDISYIVNTPSEVNYAQNYKFINSTISYYVNTSISTLNLVSIKALTDLDLSFQKYLNTTLDGDNATWKITSNVSSSSNITVNLTEVTLWVSVRNGTGTGFTNPSIHDNDTISGAELLKIYNPNVLLNSSLPQWSNPSNEWYFNYTFTSSPIVWMDIKNNIVNDGIQLTNRTITYDNNSIFIKEIYLVTGYWLQINKNITRLGDNNYNVKITVINLGNSPTPSGQVVQVYNFLPNTFGMTSDFVFSSSPWYNTSNTSEVLNDAIYNGTMYQFALIPNNNPSNSSLDLYGGSSNENNTWSAEFNISGSGEFNYEDLFLTGVDPLHVEEYGATKALSIEGAITFVSDKLGIALGVAAVIIGALALLI